MYRPCGLCLSLYLNYANRVLLRLPAAGPSQPPQAAVPGPDDNPERIKRTSETARQMLFVYR